MKVRSALLSLGFLAGGCGGAPSRPPAVRASANAAPAAESSTVVAAVSPPVFATEATPAPLPTMASALSTLRPKEGTAVLLLGLRVAPAGSFTSLFSAEGLPVASPSPGYRTLAIRVGPGGVLVQKSEPFLVVPHDPGFVFVGDETVSEGVGPPDADMQAHWYVATRVWTTGSRGAIAATERSTRAALVRARAIGTTRQESVLYATSRALAVLTSESEWTGGATAFNGDETEELRPLGAPVESSLSRYVGDADLEAFAKTTMTEREGQAPDSVDLATPWDDGWSHTIDFRKDVVATLGRAPGFAALKGSVNLRGNMHRSYDFEAVVSPAPESLGGTGAPPIRFADIAAADAGATDAFVSPLQTVVLVREGDALSAYAADGMKVATVALPQGASVVMEEWATDERADRWLSALR